MNPKILILDEPTRGIDVGAKEEIYKLIDNLAKEGMGIILISSEISEIIAISDRIAVLHEGQRHTKKLNISTIVERVIPPINIALLTGRGSDSITPE